MRLLVVSSWPPYPPDNGSQLRAYHLLQELSRRNSLTLLAFSHSRPIEGSEALQAFCERVELIPAARPARSGLGLRGLFSPVPRSLVQMESQRMRALVTSAMEGHDAAIAMQIDAARYLVDRPGNMPGVFDEAEVGVLRERYLRERTQLRRVRHGLTWWKFRRYIESVIGRFDRTTVVSDLERDHLRDLGCDSARIAVVPNGIAVPDIEIPARRALRLIYPGAVTYSANLDAVRYFVREILPLIRRSVPELAFVVTGSTVDADIRDLAASEGVTFTGRLPDVSTVIAESAACVVPLRIGGGTRLKILHAMAVSTPVVSTSKGIEGLEVEPERHVLVADTPETFAAQVVRVVRDPALGSEIAMAARQLVGERYAWGPIGRTLEGVVESAVAERRFRTSRRAGAATP